MDSKENIFAAVDAQNLWFAAKKFSSNAKLDYRKIFELIYGNQLKRDKKSFNVYIANSSNSKDFALSLESIGFNPILGYVEKEISKIINLDVLIAIDAIKFLNEYDTFILCSGNSSFIYLLRELKNRSKNVELISFQHTTSKSLFEYVDVIKFLNRDYLIIDHVEGEVNERKS